MQSIDEVARACGISQKRLHTILKNVKDRREMHRFAKNGWSLKEKNSKWMATSIIPLKIWLYFRNTYFADGQDEHEKAKNERNFLKEYPQLSARDSIRV